MAAAPQPAGQQQQLARRALRPFVNNTIRAHGLFRHSTGMPSLAERIVMEQDFGNDIHHMIILELQEQGTPNAHALQIQYSWTHCTVPHTQPVANWPQATLGWYMNMLQMDYFFIQSASGGPEIAEWPAVIDGTVQGRPRPPPPAAPIRYTGELGCTDTESLLYGIWATDIFLAALQTMLHADGHWLFQAYNQQNNDNDNDNDDDDDDDNDDNEGGEGGIYSDEESLFEDSDDEGFNPNADNEGAGDEEDAGGEEDAVDEMTAEELAQLDLD